MNKERTCPLCGLKMEWLSFQLWRCKCGYKEDWKENAEEYEEEPKRRHKLGGKKEGHIREQKQQHHKGLRST